MSITTPVSTPKVALAVDRGHDLALYRSVFQRYKRIHVPAFLTLGSALWLHETLVDLDDWNLVVNDGPRSYDLSPQAQIEAGADLLAQIAAKAQANASSQFQYLFRNHRLTDLGEPYRDPTSPLARIVAFLNSPAFLDFTRAATGLAEIEFADAQATRYDPGHFLTRHDDNMAEKRRLAAFVLMLTPEWRAECGGVLEFLDEDGQVAEGYVPQFNSLNLLAVPQQHHVSYVTPFAAAPRLAITGWLRHRG